MIIKPYLALLFKIIAEVRVFSSIRREDYLIDRMIGRSFRTRFYSNSGFIVRGLFNEGEFVFAALYHGEGVGCIV